MTDTRASLTLSLVLCLAGCGSDKADDAESGGGTSMMGGSSAVGGAGASGAATDGGARPQAGAGGIGSVAGGPSGGGGAGASGGAGENGGDPVPVQSITSCKAFKACGGDLKGEWFIKQMCASDAAWSGLIQKARPCAQATSTITQFTFQGYEEFDADSAHYEVTGRLSVGTTFPDSCLSAGGSCETAQSGLASRAGVSDATCTKMGAGCACSYWQTIPLAQRGAYETTGNTFTVTDASDGTSDTSEYCVEGDVLTIQDDDGSMTVLER